MTAPAPPAACYVRARRAVPVLVRSPDDGDTPTIHFRGRLRGAMYARGELHHYRVEDGDGALFLSPPDWIVGTPPILVPAAALEVVL